MNSVFLIDKQCGITSHSEINRLKEMPGIKKIGHCGTLDKFATGLLIVCTGWATKLTRYFLESDKRYIGTIKLGIKTDTCDPEGNITEYGDLSKLNTGLIDIIPEKFSGIQSQVPPEYSALKINGKRASDLIRNGEKVQIKERTINIKNLDIIKIDLDNSTITIDVSCSKGTYIRSLARDIGEYLGVGGYLEQLRRISSGNLSIENAATIDEIQKFISGRQIDKNFLLTPRDALSFLSLIKVKKSAVKNILNGAFFRRDDIISLENNADKHFLIVDEEENLIAIADINIDNWFIKYLNVFNNK
ncbi:MAG: tRNA pseudouridine(55) synthase TruB [Spirochaetes bacterium]|nr:tRNA pseudouridine(55) synthase TruB [Spirochaetota bacterium]